MEGRVKVPTSVTVEWSRHPTGVGPIQVLKTRERERERFSIPEQYNGSYLHLRTRVRWERRVGGFLNTDVRVWWYGSIRVTCTVTE